jgi:hypothetical protein
MGSNMFGGPKASAAIAASTGSTAPGAWPIKIEKKVGFKPLNALLVLAVVGVFTIGPSLASGIGLLDVLTHTTSGVIFIGVVLFMGFLAAVGQRRGSLTIDSSGIDVWYGKTHSFYAWGDIVGLDVVRAGVQVSLKGRSNDQNQYNLIVAGFAKNATDLRRLLNEGREKYGQDGPSGRSIAVGDDLRAARMKTLRLMAAALIGLPVLFLIGFLVWQASDAMKIADLQKYGRRADAAVLKVFTADCGRHGCSTDVQFRYTPNGSNRVFTGIQYLASDRDSDDPDLVYARSHNTVPIVYDSRNPSSVALNFDDRVFGNHSGRFMTMLAVMGGVTLIFMVIFGIVLAPMAIRALRTPQASPQNSPIVG